MASAVPCGWRTPRRLLFAMLVLVVASGGWANPVAAGPRLPVEVQTWCDIEAYTCPVLSPQAYRIRTVKAGYDWRRRRRSAVGWR